MIERSEEAALSIHSQIPRCPDGWRADIAGEHGIFSGKLVHDFCDVLRMNRRFAGLSDGQSIQVGAGGFVVLDTRIEVRAIRLVRQERRQRAQRLLYVADKADIDGCSTSNLISSQINL